MNSIILSMTFTYYIYTFISLPIFNSFIPFPSQYWQEHHQQMKRVLFHNEELALWSFSVNLLQHSNIMPHYIERISFVGCLENTHIQRITLTEGVRRDRLFGKHTQHTSLTEGALQQGHSTSLSLRVPWKSLLHTHQHISLRWGCSEIVTLH